MRMEAGSDIEDHINRMHKVYKRLNSLVTTENPLTVDDIYACAIVISIPADWVSSINGLLLNPSTDSRAIIEALNQKSTYCKAQTEKGSAEVSVSKTKALESSPSVSDKKSKGRKFCTFCRRHGHNFLGCNNAKDILSKARKEYGQSKHDEGSLKNDNSKVKRSRLRLPSSNLE